MNMEKAQEAVEEINALGAAFLEAGNFNEAMMLAPLVGKLETALTEPGPLVPATVPKVSPAPGEVPFHEQPGRSFVRPASVDPNNTNAHEERMLRWFTYDHLPANLQAVSAPWCELAVLMCHQLKPGPERTVALRKLLEGKDAAVRAALQPGA